MKLYIHWISTENVNKVSSVQSYAIRFNLSSINWEILIIFSFPTFSFSHPKNFFFNHQHFIVAFIIYETMERWNKKKINFKKDFHRNVSLFFLLIELMFSYCGCVLCMCNRSYFEMRFSGMCRFFPFFCRPFLQPLKHWLDQNRLVIDIWWHDKETDSQTLCNKHKKCSTFLFMPRTILYTFH